MLYLGDGDLIIGQRRSILIRSDRDKRNGECGSKALHGISYGLLNEFVTVSKFIGPTLPDLDSLFALRLNRVRRTRTICS